MATKIYKDIQKVSDLKSVSNISDNMEVLLAHLRKNYKLSLSKLNQNAIISAAQQEYTESGSEVPIVLNFKDNSVFRIIVKNGSKGKQGREGKQGIDGDKGDSPTINNDYAQSKGVIDWLTIANDCLTEDSNKVFSAFQGVRISEALKDITETYLSEYQYALLFTDHVTIDTEFITYEDNQLVQLIAEDPASHQRYVKYWTFESEGEQEYFVLNYFAQTYDSVYADIWTDIYLGGKTGFFEATTNQMTDGTQLYIKNDKLNKYEAIEQFNDTIYILSDNKDENGNDVFMPSSLTQGEGPWYIKRYVKEGDSYIENYSEVSKEYIDNNINKIYGQRDFLYYLKTANCTVSVKYTRENGYDFNLYGVQLPENIYVFDHVDSDGDNVYVPTNFASVDPDGTTVYYKRNSDGVYETIGDIKNYIKKKPKRFYKYVEGHWKEIEAIEKYETINDVEVLVGYDVDIDFDNYEEYIEVNYTESSNTNKFIHYSHVKTLRDEYYKVETGVLNPYTINYFVEYTEDEPRRYFTRRIITSEDNEGNTVFDYQYKEITIPFWLEAEFVTYDEDQNVRLLSRNPQENEIGDEEIIDPVYISSIEFDNHEIEIAKNYNKDIKVRIFPDNANITDMILEYDESLINIYEDGRIAALTNDEITKETTIKVYSERDNTIGDEIKIRVVTPIEKISLNVDQINLYPGTSFDLSPIIYPEIVTNSNLVYQVSNPNMLMIDNNGKVSPKPNSDGTFNMGNCNLTITAADGFGAQLTIPVLVATPITKINIKSRSFGFVGINQLVETEVLPLDATLKILDYASSDESIFTVTDQGLIKPISEGTATLICSTRDGSGVKAQQDIKITTAVNEIKITGLNDSIEVGLTNDIEIEVLPENATDKQIKIFASDNSVIDYTEPVLKEGTTNVYTMSISGVAGGSTQFVVNTVDGSETFIERQLTIPIPIERISFEEPNITIYEGDDIKVIRTIVTGPESTANNSLDWFSSNTNVVTVDVNGRISPVKAGKAKVSAISKDDNKVIGTCNVTVKKHTESIELNIDSEISILENNYGFVSVYIMPYDASDQILRWASSNENICTVEDNGTIYGKKIGEATVTVMPIDRSDVSKSFTVKVVKQINND